MGLIWIIAGAVFGALLGATVARGSTSLFGLLFGAGFGYLLWHLGELTRRLHKGEERLAALEQTQLRAGIARSQSRSVAEATLDLRDVATSTPAVPPVPKSIESIAPDESPAFEPAPAILPVPPTPAVPVAPRVVKPIFDEQPKHWREEPANDVFVRIKDWFTEGNVPVKVGMLVLFAGVAALLKYAADEGWFTFPIEFRLVGVTLASIAALVFAWRQRDTRRAFSLSLQGGAIGILLLTVFAAFRLYHLLPATVAFALMLILVAGVCVLAVLQDAIALAVLGILAGFAAPILISTGSGNHVFLFSYYGLLNIAILVIAWQRAWRVLNLIGFVFTYAIGTIWGVLSYRTNLFDSTEPFLLLFFAIYLAVPILYALKRSPDQRDAIDSTLLFGNPLAAFALQGALLDWERTPLAISALGLGIIYLLLAVSLIRRVRILGESFAVLALGFSTLSVPLALSARTTGCIFALEGAALVWLGLRQERRLPRWIGLLLQLLAAGAFVIAFEWGHAEYVTPLANGHFVGAVLICLGGLVCAWLYQRARSGHALTTILYLWGLCWWFGAWLVEIHRFIPSQQKLTAVLAVFAVSAWLAAEAARHWRRLALMLTTTILFWLIVPLSILIFVDGRIFANWNLLAYAVLALAGWRSLACLRDSHPVVRTATHLGWFWIWTVVIALRLIEIAADASLGTGWLMAMIALPLLALFLLVLRRPEWVAVPLSGAFVEYRNIVLSSQAIMLIGMLGISLFVAGASDPLIWLPILNPLELFQLAAFVLLARWIRDTDAPDGFQNNRPALLSIAGFLLITSATLRAAHHMGGVPWEHGLLSASLSQTSLTVVWSILGVAGWVIGSRRGNRSLWLASALLMSVVLLKLVHCLRPALHPGRLPGSGTTAERKHGECPMTRWLLLACMVAQTASAFVPADYAQVIPIVTAGDSAAWQVELAASVYAGSVDANLRDLAVFNADGEAVPMKIQAAEYVDSVTEQRSAVAVLALPRDRRSVEANDLGLIVERDAKGRLRRIETQAVSDPDPFPETREWLLDIGDAERGIDRVELGWNDPGQGVIAHFQLTGSNDLQRWDSLNADATVVDLQQDGARIERRIITFPATRLRYLRLRRLDTGVALSGLRAEASRINRVAGIAPLQWVDAAAIDHIGELEAEPRLHLYSLPYPLPVSDVRIDLANDNGLAEVDVLSPLDTGNGTLRWIPRAHLVAFRLVQDGERIDNGAITLSRGSRLQTLRINSATPLSTAPRLTVGYRPARLIFLAEGKGPFVLAVGSATARYPDTPVDAALASLRTRYGKDWQPATASLGVAQASAGEQALRAPPVPRDWKRWLLWVALIGAALVVGGIALSLLRDHGQGGAEDRQQPPEE